jgi:hypothetical protein
MRDKSRSVSESCSQSKRSSVELDGSELCHTSCYGLCCPTEAEELFRWMQGRFGKVTTEVRAGPEKS